MILTKGLTSPSTHSGRRAANVVEFAIVGPVLFLIILGMIELARGYMVSHLLTNAARAGCRVGILGGRANADVTTAVNNQLGYAGIRNDSVTILVNEGGTDVANAKSGDEVTVSVTVPVSSVSWVPVTRYLGTSITGRYTLRRE